MSIDEILKAIRHSDSSEWRMLADGPTYRGIIVSHGSVGVNAGMIDYREHPHAYVFGPDARLTLAFGLDLHEGEDRDYGFNNEFADESVSECLVDFFFCGALVHRERLLNIDGHRALLPICRQRYSSQVDQNGKKTIEYIATSESRDVARLVHSFHHTEDFESYLTRAGIIVMD